VQNNFARAPHSATDRRQRLNKMVVGQRSRSLRPVLCCRGLGRGLRHAVLGHCSSWSGGGQVRVVHFRQWCYWRWWWLSVYL